VHGLPEAHATTMNETVYLFALSSPELLERFVAVDHMQVGGPAATTLSPAADVTVWSAPANLRAASRKARQVRADWVQPDAHRPVVAARRSRRTA
jgi:hypothetical protein